MSLILATGYNGALTSRLSAPRYEPLIDTFKQLAASDKRLAVGKGTNMAKHFLVTPPKKIQQTNDKFAQINRPLIDLYL